MAEGNNNKHVIVIVLVLVVLAGLAIWQGLSGSAFFESIKKVYSALFEDSSGNFTFSIIINGFLVWGLIILGFYLNSLRENQNDFDWKWQKYALAFLVAMTISIGGGDDVGKMLLGEENGYYTDDDNEIRYGILQLKVSGPQGDVYPLAALFLTALLLYSLVKSLDMLKSVTTGQNPDKNENGVLLFVIAIASVGSAAQGTSISSLVWAGYFLLFLMLKTTFKNALGSWGSKVAAFVLAQWLASIVNVYSKSPPLLGIESVWVNAILGAIAFGIYEIGAIAFKAGWKKAKEEAQDFATTKLNEWIVGLRKKVENLGKNKEELDEQDRLTRQARQGGEGA